MVFDEYEIKYLLQKSDYEKLLEIFSDSDTKTVEQINYYYDTYDQKMRKNNITARIREKNGKLTGVIKEHSVGTTHSKETSFRVDGVSNVISYNGENLYLYGELYTKRMEINFCDSITLMLDYNKYLDTEDYELEIEYEFHDCEDAIYKNRRLEDILGKIELVTVSQSKSERFFKRLNNINTVKHEGM